jgi:hypothetical protein
VTGTRLELDGEGAVGQAVILKSLRRVLPERGESRSWKPTHSGDEDLGRLISRVSTGADPRRDREPLRARQAGSSFSTLLLELALPTWQKGLL